MIKNHSDIRRQHTEYTLLAQETNASHVHFNRSKRLDLHKTQKAPEKAYQVSYTSPSEIAECKKAPRNPYHEKQYKVIDIPFNLVEDIANYQDDQDDRDSFLANDPNDSLYFSMLGWYMRKALYL